jgi:hypothetical protein
VNAQLAWNSQVDARTVERHYEIAPDARPSRTRSFLRIRHRLSEESPRRSHAGIAAMPPFIGRPAMAERYRTTNEDHQQDCGS